MKINSTPNYINQVYGNQQVNNPVTQDLRQDLKAQKNADETQTDSLNLSNKTKDLQKISKAMETESTDRAKYVADIKQKVETNQYDINAELVAEKMGNFILNEVI
jgi:flagellar biosynthesis anti-sigma factor FlgM